MLLLQLIVHIQHVLDMAIAQKEHVFVRKVGKVWTVLQWIKMRYNVYQIVQDMEHLIWIHNRVIVKPNGVVMTVLKVKGPLKFYLVSI